MKVHQRRGGLGNAHGMHVRCDSGLDEGMSLGPGENDGVPRLMMATNASVDVARAKRIARITP